MIFLPGLCRFYGRNDFFLNFFKDGFFRKPLCQQVHIETGNTKGSLPTFILIANALQVSLDDILCDSLEYETVSYHHEIAELTKDCSPLELRVITDMVNATKSILRNRHLVD